MRNKGKKSLRRRLSECAALCAAALFLWGCAGVEPEKRAYPLAVSVDYINGEYEVVYGMANLPADTGQGKDPQAGGAEQNAGTVFRGKDLKEIQKLRAARLRVLALPRVCRQISHSIYNLVFAVDVIHRNSQRICSCLLYTSRCV